MNELYQGILVVAIGFTIVLGCFIGVAIMEVFHSFANSGLPESCSGRRRTAVCLPIDHQRGNFVGGSRMACLPWQLTQGCGFCIS